MAVGMFGRKPMFGQIPGIGMMQPQMQQPMMQAGAMQPDMGDMTKRTPFFQRSGVKQGIGILGDTLSILGGGQATYAPAMIAQKQQDAEIRARLQAALEKRKADREDKQWEWETKPKEAPNNDTVNDFNWYSKLTPEQRNLYHQMKPTIAFRADGTPIAVNPMQLGQPQQSGPKPGTIEDGHEFIGGDPSNPASWRPVGGGGVGNGTRGF